MKEDDDNQQNCKLTKIIRAHSISMSKVEKTNVQLSADELFPILVWVVVHCRVHDIHMRLGYLQKFLDDSIKFFGEVGMCLSLVQAAAEFVRKKEDWHFGLDPDLDKDTLDRNDKQQQNDKHHHDDIAPDLDKQEIEM